MLSAESRILGSIASKANQFGAPGTRRFGFDCIKLPFGQTAIRGSTSY